MPEKPERPERPSREQEPDIIKSTMHPQFKDPAFVEGYSTCLEYERWILSLQRQIAALTAELASVTQERDEFKASFTGAAGGEKERYIAGIICSKQGVDFP